MPLYAVDYPMRDGTLEDEDHDDQIPHSSTPDMTLAPTSSPPDLSPSNATETQSELAYGTFSELSNDGVDIGFSQELMERLAHAATAKRQPRCRLPLSRDAIRSSSTSLDSLQDGHVPLLALSVSPPDNFDDQMLPAASSPPLRTHDDSRLAFSLANLKRTRSAQDPPAYSLLVDSDGFSPGASALFRMKEELDEALKDTRSKRPRTSRYFIPASATQLLYSREPASLRKARSLLSDVSLADSDSPEMLTGSQAPYKAHTSTSPSPQIDTDFELTTPSHFRSAEFDLLESYVSTAPATPVPMYDPPLPVYMRIAEVPLCDEDAAESRLRVLLQKDAGTGRPAALKKTEDSPSLAPSPSSSSSGSDSDPFSSQSLDENLASDEEEDICSISQDYETDVKDGLRTQAIRWIITVVPPVDAKIDTKKPRIYSRDLYDQLTTNPDTRFLAAYFFGRFLLEMTTGKPNDGEPSDVEIEAVSASRQEELDEGQRRIVWDFAVAAVALSVKVQRDFLAPLTPIFARDFLVLAPHEMNRGDLEAAQRDILLAFSYNMGVPTPQAFLDELYLALPTLRALLDFEHGWICVLGETWKQLLVAICEPDVFRFSVSLLTATALEEAIMRVVRCQVAQDASACLCSCHGSGSRADLGNASWRSAGASNSGLLDGRHTLLSALAAAALVVGDIKDVLGLAEVEVNACRRWLSPLL